MSGEAPLQVYGLSEVRKAFKQADKIEGPKTLKEAYASVSKLVATMAQDEARSGTPLQRAMAKAIKPKTTLAHGAGLVVTSNYVRVSGKGAGPRQAHKIDADGRTVYVRAKAGQSVTINSQGSLAAAWVAFWGTDRRIGWFAQARYRGTGRDQHLPPWVGSNWAENWQAGRFSEGPYAIRDAVRKNMPEIERQFLDAIAEAHRRMGFDVD